MSKTKGFLTFSGGREMEYWCETERLLSKKKTRLTIVFVLFREESLGPWKN